MMKRWLPGLGLILVLTSAALAGPAVEITNDSFDFGQTMQHAKVNRVFWVKSVGDETLRINTVNPGCGCTKAPLADSVLAPGDSTALEIIFSTKSYRGPITKRPYILTNASEEKVYLKISAILLPDETPMEPISLIPARLDVSQFSEKPRRVASFLIENHSDRDYKIKLVDGEGKLFEIKLPGKVKAGESVKGRIRVLEGAIQTEFEQSLTFEINDDKQSRFTLPIKRTYRILNDEQ